MRVGSAVLGVRGTPGAWHHDISFGRQLFTLGTGMLLTVGSSNGFSWGGAASVKRLFWGSSVMAAAGRGPPWASTVDLGVTASY